MINYEMEKTIWKIMTKYFNKILDGKIIQKITTNYFKMKSTMKRIIYKIVTKYFNNITATFIWNIFWIFFLFTEINASTHDFHEFYHEKSNTNIYTV